MNKNTTTYKQTKIRKQELKENKNHDISDTFDSSRIANFTDDPVGVLGWKGTGILVVIIILGFTFFQFFFN